MKTKRPQIRAKVLSACRDNLICKVGLCENESVKRDAVKRDLEGQGGTMGCRGQVKIVSECTNQHDVYLYTHWDADTLPETVKRALAKNWRWDDSCYLARIIFDEIVGVKGHGQETGYGICTARHDDIECLVIVNVDKQTVAIDRSMYGGKKGQPVSFEEFIQ